VPVPISDLGFQGRKTPLQVIAFNCSQQRIGNLRKHSSVVPL
jgi:hypothetical protein